MSESEPGPIFNRAASTYDRVVPMFAQFGQRTVEASPLRMGDRVLDIACGRGATLFPALEKVGPRGHVTGIDIAPEMVRLTSEDVAQRGIANVRVAEMDARDLQFADASFDAVICAFAIFLIPQPERVLQEICRVLKPGGAVTLSTWVGDDRRWAWMGPLAGLLLGPVARRSADPYKEEGSLQRALGVAGLSVSTIDESDTTLYFRDLDHWIEWMRSHGGLVLIDPLEQTEGAMARFNEAAGRETSKFREEAGIPLLQRARYTVAVRPG
ncbi:MAG TPA: class I SAM-dependent methyltransferase [Candidatus Dormibacteraeota bacterium]|nr:class I SAM-dependent methyltransferase [Candidatus Dormibacteraeota bacterium]